MKTNKYCCKNYPIILVIIALVIALAIWYFEEGMHSFLFLSNKNEIFNFLGTLLFFAVIPIGIFYLATEKERFKNKANQLALLGFLPTLIFFLFVVL